ncbi:O-methyltransferase [Saliterribacillus persicus]|uniref:tRNA 5-hydroxyuridine methyltransferase n=1 Tax=Saliterribacillus persicus TaxID=930114 RepID=A0A368XBD5_9BACI|nr:O-methyltransferase [Saliterribacillus persicus]RCW65281.1 putative O-methyltransferase YrrM [Saliterribacillus persicus]
MNSETVKRYLNGLKQDNIEWINHLEKEAKEHHVPIMDSISIDILKQIIRLHQPNSILEIGTAIGYSALQMVQAKEDIKVVSIERNEEMFTRAQKNMEKYDTNNCVKLIYGDALEVADKIDELGSFDLIFIDAAKGKYRDFFELYQSFLSENGVILTDNVLFRGYAINQELAPKRLKKLAEKIDLYNKWLIDNKNYHTTIIPVGDGIAISLKKNKGDN